jgi:anaerobic selenocysteine-containing dehydrogenase
MLPESNTVKEALCTRELVVVVDSFLTDTAELAHLVLPTTTLLEADDLLGAYGHHYLGVANPVVPPPDGVKSDLEIVQALAARVGLTEEMAGTARDWKRRILKPKLEPHGIGLEAIEAGPVPNPLAKRVLFEDRRFPTSSGRINLIGEPAVEPERPRADYPLLLLALSTDKSQSSQWAKTPRGPLEATIHPDAAAGVPDGGLGVLESPLGSMTVVVRHDAAQRRDVVLVPKGGHLRDGRCANALIRARTTDHGEGGALYDEAVRLVPASS